MEGLGLEPWHCGNGATPMMQFCLFSLACVSSTGQEKRDRREEDVVRNTRPSVNPGGRFTPPCCLRQPLPHPSSGLEFDTHSLFISQVAMTHANQHPDIGVKVQPSSTVLHDPTRRRPELRKTHDRAALARGVWPRPCLPVCSVGNELRAGHPGWRAGLLLHYSHFSRGG